MNEEKMKKEKTQGWLRTLCIIIGVITIILGIAVLLMPDAGIESLMLLLYFALLVIGLGRILIGALAKLLPRGLRIMSIVVGVILFVLAVVVLVYPIFAVAFLVSLLAVALVINGVTRIMIGGFVKIIANWVRGLFVVGGCLSLILSCVVLAFPGIALLSLVFLLSFALIWNGIDAIVSGVTGAP